MRHGSCTALDSTLSSLTSLHARERSLLGEPAAEQQVLLGSVGRRPGSAGYRLLRQEACSSEHRKAAVRELALLHEAELSRVFGLEAERIKAQIAGLVVVLEELHVAHALIRVRPSLLDAERLGDADAERHEDPDRRGECRDLLNGGTTIAREERVEELLDEEARGREHRHTAVRELGLAEPINFALGAPLKELSRVEVTRRRDVARETKAKLWAEDGSILQRVSSGQHAPSSSQDGGRRQCV